MAPAAIDLELPEGLEQRIGQMLLVGFRGLTVAEAAPTVRHLVAGAIGGLLLYDADPQSQAERNVRSPAQLRALVRGLKAAARASSPPIPPFVAIDAEGGFYHRLKEKYGFPPTRPARDLGEQNDLAATHASASEIAATLARMDIDVNLAPVLDLLSPDNISLGIRRDFSADPDIVAANARAWVRAHHERGVRTVVKHFPGMGRSTRLIDGGSGEETADWTERALGPYRALLGEGLVDAVMVTRVTVLPLDPDRPATLSPRIVGDLLRGELGFDGPVVSDAMETPSLWGAYGLERSAVAAVNAGVDILLFSNYGWLIPYDDDIAPRVVRAIAEAVERGEIAESRIAEACGRVLALKRRLLADAALR